MSEKRYQIIILLFLSSFKTRGVFEPSQWSQQAIIHHGLQHGVKDTMYSNGIAGTLWCDCAKPQWQFCGPADRKRVERPFNTNVEFSSRKMFQTESFFSLRSLSNVFQKDAATLKNTWLIFGITSFQRLKARVLPSLYMVMEAWFLWTCLFEKRVGCDEQSMRCCTYWLWTSCRTPVGAMSSY